MQTWSLSLGASKRPVNFNTCSQSSLASDRLLYPPLFGFSLELDIVQQTFVVHPERAACCRALELVVSCIRLVSSAGAIRAIGDIVCIIVVLTSGSSSHLLPPENHSKDSPELGANEAPGDRLQTSTSIALPQWCVLVIFSSYSAQAVAAFALALLCIFHVEVGVELHINNWGRATFFVELGTQCLVKISIARQAA
eukprot:6480785-Amphidinium_carterae.4